MHRLNVKPLSVNLAWRGRRYKTDKYKSWSEVVFWQLPDGLQLFPLMQLNIVWGFSSAGSDIDNPLKPFIDQLQKQYSFNDNQIKRLVVEVEQTRKGNEFIKFELIEYEKRF